MFRAAIEFFPNGFSPMLVVFEGGGREEEGSMRGERRRGWFGEGEESGEIHEK